MAWSAKARAAALAARRRKAASKVTGRPTLRNRRRHASLSSHLLTTTDQTRGRVAGSTRLRKATQQYRAGIAIARSMKGTRANRYAPQNKGGIRRRYR